MNMRPRQRGVYVTASQKKKLIELMAKHPDLITCKVKQGFNYADSQRLWLMIANECNSMAGAKKTWRQWKKTWQDIRSKVKKKQVINGEVPIMAAMLTVAEQEALGIKNVSSTTNCQDTAQEFIPLAEESESQNFDNESMGSFSEPESPPEHKVFIRTRHKEKKIKPTKNKHKDTCAFNCETLAVQEQKKIKIKEDYLNFKKDYLKQKLIILREQTEALKSIARELSK